MARILAQQEHALSPGYDGMPAASDPFLQQAKTDTRKCLDILDVICVVPETQKTRTEVLRTAFQDILW